MAEEYKKSQFKPL